MRRVAHASAAAAAARAGYAALTAAPPGGAARWARTNHRGEPVTLLEGPAYAFAAAIAAAAAPGLPRRLRAAAALATAGAGVFGAVDDLGESGASKGLRGHLGELARGRVTTGGLKVLGIGATGLVAAALARPHLPPSAGTSPGTRRRVATELPALARTPRECGHFSGNTPACRDRTARTRGGRRNLGGGPGGAEGTVGPAGLLVAGGLVAGAANLANLFDLRPGRALKVVLLAAPAAAARGPAGGLVAAACAPAAALLPDDLGERAMLGDTGANAAGALLGMAACAGFGPRGRLAALAVVTGLTLASERVSFTSVIARTPGLRELDALGRRPAEPVPR